MFDREYAIKTICANIPPNYGRDEPICHYFWIDGTSPYEEDIWFDGVIHKPNDYGRSKGKKTLLEATDEELAEIISILKTSKYFHEPAEEKGTKKMKEWNDEQRWILATKLEGILGADLDLNEEDAIHDAIRLICPEYAAMRDADEQEAAEWWESTTDAEKDALVQEMQEKYPSKDGTQIGGKILRFGEKNHD